MAALGTRSEGLSWASARSRLRRSGRTPPHHRRPPLVLLLRQFANPTTWILIFATLASAALGEAASAAVILTIVLLGALLGFFQEYRAARAVEDLLARVQVTVEVRRGGRAAFVPAHEVVAGDILLVDTGDLVPGDSRILEARDLLVDQAPLTGESFPVEKAPGAVPADTPVAGRTNCLFEGTHVVRGRAVAVIVCTGAATLFSRIAAEADRSPAPTRFEVGLRTFGGLLLRLMIGLAAVMFAANLLLARSFAESMMFAVALAVGLTPQLLPAIVSVSLSLGAREMTRAGVIVKRLSAIEDFGGMDVLCVDKTGTLTQGIVRLAGALDLNGAESAGVRESAYLNAFHQTGYANPIDDAIIAAEHVDLADSRRFDEVPYDFVRRRLSVGVARGGVRLLVTKGALRSVLDACATAEGTDGRIMPIAEVRPAIERRFAMLSDQGYRVLGVARKRLTAGSPLGPADESGLTFQGFLSFLDPPKPGVDRTLRELAALGISVRMITGDNRLAAARAASAVGLSVDTVLSGADIALLADAELARAAAGVTVFAEVDPLQKERLVSALRRAGHGVGFLGDGINDAPALHAADVGISVDGAVDVAKDTASIVLMRKDLGVLCEGVRLGRRTFANTLKYVFVTTSANFGNMASLALTTLFLPFLPLLPLQILLVNFLSDLPGTTIATDHTDPEQLQRPGAWDLRFIRDFMVAFGLVSTGFDLLTFALLRFATAGAELFRTGWFLESVATEIAVMLVLRTRRRFYRSGPSGALLASSLLAAVLAASLPFTPLAASLGLVPPPPLLLGALAAITVAYVVVTELAKARFFAPAALGGAAEP